jgi:glycerol-3-phosphate cytidylyltransferase
MVAMTVGLVCGAFDLCHAGHVLLLAEAKTVCSHLVVGLHDDPSVQDDADYRLSTAGALKRKPIMSIEERTILLQGSKYVDELFVYKTESDLLLRLLHSKPPIDVRIFGADWRGKKYTGIELGHKVHFASRDHGYSSTELRQRIARAELPLGPSSTEVPT